MGRLERMPVSQLVGRYGMLQFVETGTWKGDGLLHALAHSELRRCFSVEANLALALEAERRVSSRYPANKFGPYRWSITVGDSSLVMGDIVAQLTDGPCLWWLDAHLPERYDGAATRLPLLQELRIITAARDVARDVFLVDDVRLYQRGRYGSGPSPVGQPGAGHWNEVWDQLKATHQLQVDTRDEGYLVAVPG